MPTISRRGLSENLGLFFFVQPKIKCTREKYILLYEKELKEDLKMRDFVKFAAVGLAGYFIGFFEMKYKAMKVITQGFIDQAEESKKDSKEEEEES